MRFFDDGRVGMSFEPTGGTLRFLSVPAAYGQPAYCAVGMRSTISERIGKLAALRGADDLEKICRKRIGNQGEVTKDGKFSWVEVECLGACVNAPMAQINYDYYEDLTAESFNKILDDLAAGKKVKPGPQIDRQLSAPVGGATTLKEKA